MPFFEVEQEEINKIAVAKIAGSFRFMK